MLKSRLRYTRVEKKKWKKSKETSSARSKYSEIFGSARMKSEEIYDVEEHVLRPDVTLECELRILVGGHEIVGKG